jgi:uncharacterized protein (TIGR02246 family)
MGFLKEAAMISTHVKTTLIIFSIFSFSYASLWAQAQPKVSDADSSSIKQVVAGYSEAFNHHDAHASAILFAEDADFTNLRGAYRHGQKDIEQIFVSLYAGMLKNAHRTDTVKNIRFLTPEIAVMEDFWEITGSKTPDGLDNPDRKGLFGWVLTKVNGQWKITVFHEAEFPK